MQHVWLSSTTSKSLWLFQCISVYENKLGSPTHHILSIGGITTKLSACQSTCLSDIMHPSWLPWSIKTRKVPYINAILHYGQSILYVSANMYPMVFQCFMVPISSKWWVWEVSLLSYALEQPERLRSRARSSNVLHHSKWTRLYSKYD